MHLKQKAPKHAEYKVKNDFYNKKKYNLILILIRFFNFLVACQVHFLCDFYYVYGHFLFKH